MSGRWISAVAAIKSFISSGLRKAISFLGTCLDTNAFIDAWVRKYPIEIFPGVWEQIDQEIFNGKLISSEEVLVELERQADDLHSWVKQRRQMFMPLSADIQNEVKTILQGHPRLIDTRKNRSGADPWVIATARVSNAVLVSNEKGGTLDKPKIPFVCTQLDVECIDLLEMIRVLGWKF